MSVFKPAEFDDVVHVNCPSVACVTLHTEPPIETLVFEVKPFPFNVKTKPPLLLPSTGDILWMEGKPFTLTLEVANPEPLKIFEILNFIFLS